MKCFGMLLDGRAQKTGIRKQAEDETILMVLNGFEGVVDFTMPEATGGAGWELLVDTNLPKTPEGSEFPLGHIYQVTGRSLLLLKMKRAGVASAASTKAAADKKRGDRPSKKA